MAMPQRDDPPTPSSFAEATEESIGDPLPREGGLSRVDLAGRSF